MQSIPFPDPTPQEARAWQQQIEDEVALWEAQEWWHEEATTEAMHQREAALRQLPEAPASVNTYIMVAGYKTQLTLRDTDEDRLLARLEAVLTRFPVPRYA